MMCYIYLEIAESFFDFTTSSVTKNTQLFSNRRPYKTEALPVKLENLWVKGVDIGIWNDSTLSIKS